MSLSKSSIKFDCCITKTFKSDENLMSRLKSKSSEGGGFWKEIMTIANEKGEMSENRTL